MKHLKYPGNNAKISATIATVVTIVAMSIGSTEARDPTFAIEAEIPLSRDTSAMYRIVSLAWLKYLTTHRSPTIWLHVENLPVSWNGKNLTNAHPLIKQIAKREIIGIAIKTLLLYITHAMRIPILINSVTHGDPMGVKLNMLPERYQRDDYLKSIDTQQRSFNSQRTWHNHKRSSLNNRLPFNDQATFNNHRSSFISDQRTQFDAQRTPLDEQQKTSLDNQRTSLHNKRTSLYKQQSFNKVGEIPITDDDPIDLTSYTLNRTIVISFEDPPYGQSRTNRLVTNRNIPWHNNPIVRYQRSNKYTKIDTTDLEYRYAHNIGHLLGFGHYVRSTKGPFAQSYVYRSLPRSKSVMFANTTDIKHASQFPTKQDLYAFRYIAKHIDSILEKTICHILKIELPASIIDSYKRYRKYLIS